VTECTPQPLLFSNLRRQKIQADFAGGRLTSDAGGLLLREADRQLGLIDAVASCLTDSRDPAKITHDQRTMLAQRIFGMALGYEDLNDHDELRRDPLFSVLADQPPNPEDPLASSPTLCRLENRVDRQALVRMSGVLVEQFMASRRNASSTASTITTAFAVVRVLRVPVAGGLPAAEQHRPLVAHPGHPQAAGDASAAGLAEGASGAAGRLRLCPLQAAAVVREKQCLLRGRPGPQQGARAAGRSLYGVGREAVRTDSAESAELPPGPLRGQDLGSPASRDRQGGTFAARAQRALRADQSGRTAGHDLRPALHAAWRHGEPHQGAAAHALCRPGELPRLSRQISSACCSVPPPTS